MRDNYAGSDNSVLLWPASPQSVGSGNKVVIKVFPGPVSCLVIIEKYRGEVK